MTAYDEKRFFSFQHSLPGPSPGTRPGGEAFAHGKARWDPLPVGAPPAGGAEGVGGSVRWVAAEGMDLGGPIPGRRI